jgi:hypothetical protein
MRLEGDVLLDKMAEKKMLFEQMLTVSREQVDLLKEHQEDPQVVAKITALVNKRKQLIEAVNRLEKGLDGTDKEELSAGYTEQNSEIRAIMLSIQENDKQAYNLAQILLNRIGKKLKQTRGQKKVNQAYTKGPAETGAWFFDKKK